MTLHRVFLSVIILVLVSACSSNPTITLVNSTMTLTPDPVREEELVYGALLQAIFTAKYFVIMDMTQTDVIDMAGPETYQLIEDSFLDLSNETLANFKTSNLSSQPIKTSMIQDFEYILLSMEEMQDLFRENQNGWDIFYNRYPEAPGIITLSRVGFNNSMDQALVYLGIQSHWLAGSGTYYLMEKKDGIWVIQQQVMTWVS